jgi:hypothetical protein
MGKWNRTGEHQKVFGPGYLARWRPSMLDSIIRAGKVGRVNLSGTWLLNHEESTMKWEVPVDIRYVIVHSDPELKFIRYRVKCVQRENGRWYYQEDELSVTLVADGVVHIEESSTRNEAYTLWWHGEVLTLRIEYAPRGEENGRVVQLGMRKVRNKLLISEISTNYREKNKYVLDNAGTQYGLVHINSCSVQ